MTAIIQSARARFIELTGHEAESVWTAPGRVNLIGEHTDYNQGFVLPFAIDRHAVVAIGRRDDGILRVASAWSDEAVEVPLAGLGTLVASGSLDGWAAYPLGVAWALGETGAPLDELSGCDLLIESDVPVGAGLSSSAAIECSVAAALDALWGLELSREGLAKVGQHAENIVVGAPTGIMDQMASMLGHRDAAVLIDCRTLESQQIPLHLTSNELVILVIDTGVNHSHATGGYRERREACERAAATLRVPSLRDVDLETLQAARDKLDDVTFRRARHVVTENARVLETVRLLASDGPRAIGDLLDASHRSMRDDFEISVPELDLAVEVAQSHGAIGARMTGGGFGGSAIALVGHHDLRRVENAIVESFAEHVYGSPELFVVTPSHGASRYVA